MNAEPRPEHSFQNLADDADNEDNGDEELANRQAAELLKPEETGQNWLLRHLRSHLENVPELILTDFVLQQVFHRMYKSRFKLKCLGHNYFSKLYD